MLRCRRHSHECPSAESDPSCRESKVFDPSCGSPSLDRCLPFSQTPFRDSPTACRVPDPDKLPHRRTLTGFRRFRQSLGRTTYSGLRSTRCSSQSLLDRIRYRTAMSQQSEARECSALSSSSFRASFVSCRPRHHVNASRARHPTRTPNADRHSTDAARSQRFVGPIHATHIVFFKDERPRPALPSVGLPVPVGTAAADESLGLTPSRPASGGPPMTSSRFVGSRRSW